MGECQDSHLVAPPNRTDGQGQPMGVSALKGRRACPVSRRGALGGQLLPVLLGSAPFGFNDW